MLTGNATHFVQSLISVGPRLITNVAIIDGKVDFSHPVFTREAVYVENHSGSITFQIEVVFFVNGNRFNSAKRTLDPGCGVTLTLDNPDIDVVEVCYTLDGEPRIMRLEIM